MLDLHKMRQFYVLARTGSYVRAAEELHLSQSALTRNIQSLEKRYGVTLVERERGRRGLTLTEAGQRALRHAQEILRRADEIERDLRREGGRRAERISFGLGPMLASVLLPDMLGPLVSADGRLSVHVVIQSPATMMEQLLAGDIDFYLGQSAGPDGPPPRVRQELVGLGAPRLWVRPEHPLASRDPVELEAVGDYALASGEAWNATMVPLLEDEHLQDLLTAKLQIDNYDLLVDVVQNSDAILVSLFGDRRNRLVQLPLGEELPTPPSPLYFFSLRGIQPSPLAAQIKEALKSRFNSLTR